MESWSEKYRLAHSEPSVVYDWLRTNRESKKPLNSREIEESLLSRDDPIINLGLALFGIDIDTGKQLYEKGDPTIQKAVLSGTIIEEELLSPFWLAEILPGLLANWEIDKLEALMRNRHIPDSVLVDLYRRNKPFAELEEDQWILLCTHTCWNERLAFKRPEDFCDGEAEYRSGECIKAAWRLFATMPTTVEAANLLIALGKKLPPAYPSIIDPMTIMQRWQSPEDDRCAERFEIVRTCLAKLVLPSSKHFKAFEDHQDPALRKAFYMAFQHPDLAFIQKGFERDGEDFLGAVLFNDRAFANSELRHDLEQRCIRSDQEDLWYVLRQRTERMEELHPDWYRQEEQRPSLNDRLDELEDMIQSGFEIQGTKTGDMLSPLLRNTEDVTKELEAIMKRVEEIDLQLTETNGATETQRVLIEMQSKIKNLYGLKLTDRKQLLWGCGVLGLGIGVIIGYLAASIG